MIMLYLTYTLALHKIVRMVHVMS